MFEWPSIDFSNCVVLPPHWTNCGVVVGSTVIETEIVVVAAGAIHQEYKCFRSSQCRRLSPRLNMNICNMYEFRCECWCQTLSLAEWNFQTKLASEVFSLGRSSHLSNYLTVCKLPCQLIKSSPVTSASVVQSYCLDNLIWNGGGKLSPPFQYWTNLYFLVPMLRRMIIRRRKIVVQMDEIETKAEVTVVGKL